MPNCPYCETEMKDGGSGVVNGFPDDDDSPQYQWWYCDTELTDYCKQRQE